MPEEKSLRKKSYCWKILREQPLHFVTPKPESTFRLLVKNQPVNSSVTNFQPLYPSFCRLQKKLPVSRLTGSKRLHARSQNDWSFVSFGNRWYEASCGEEHVATAQIFFFRTISDTWIFKRTLIHQAEALELSAEHLQLTHLFLKASFGLLTSKISTYCFFWRIHQPTLARYRPQYKLK